MEAGHRLAYTRMCVFPTTIVDSTELTVQHCFHLTNTPNTQFLSHCDCDNVCLT